MIVSDYLEAAVRSELSSLSIKDIGIGSNEPSATQLKNRETLIGYLNQALLAIYSKFSLKQDEIVIHSPVEFRRYTVPSDFLYPVDAKLADGQEIGVNNDRMVILDGKEVLLSIMFPSPLKFEVKGIGGCPEDTAISMVYAVAPNIVENYTDHVDLRSSFTEAVLLYMGYRATCSTGVAGESTNSTFLSRYNFVCDQVLKQGCIDTDNLNSNVKLCERGFV